jgi:hypothetical protein
MKNAKVNVFKKISLIITSLLILVGLVGNPLPTSGGCIDYDDPDCGQNG